MPTSERASEPCSGVLGGIEEASGALDVDHPARQVVGHRGLRRGRLAMAKRVEDPVVLVDCIGKRAPLRSFGGEPRNPRPRQFLGDDPGIPAQAL